MLAKRRDRPARTLEQWITHGHRAHALVKFDDGVPWPCEDGVERFFEGDLRRLWIELERDFRGITLRRLFPLLDAEAIEGMVRQAQTLTPGYRAPRLASCFAVECPPGRPPRELARRLATLPRVETAYLESTPAPPPDVGFEDDPLFGRQAYLGAAPKGVSIRSAWKYPGGDGAGVRLADIEQGWLLKHEDLPGIQVLPSGYGVSHRDKPHGTAVLGVVLARDNAVGCVGAAPGARGHAVSEYWDSIPSPFQQLAESEEGGLWYSPTLAVGYAAWLLGRGDVMLIESELEVETGEWGTDTYQYHCYPVEYEPIIWMLIRLATARGIAVVEPAGNGMEDLDDPALQGRFDARRHDSGAIMVGAAEWVADPPGGAGFKRLGLSSWGSRVDCFSWGSDVVTLGPPGVAQEGGVLPAGYISNFGGTSSASAILAGCAAVLQGLARWRFGQPLDPGTLRGLLRDRRAAAGNTRTLADRNCQPGAFVDRIGVQPSLGQIVQHLIW